VVEPATNLQGLVLFTAKDVVSEKISVAYVQPCDVRKRQAMGAQQTIRFLKTVVEMDY